MFITKKNHLFTNVLLQTAIINSVEMAVSAVLRFRMRNQFSMAPDMLNQQISRMQIGLTIVRLILISAVFFHAFRKLNAARSSVPRDDYSEMAKLQEEMNPGGITSLSSYSISQLLQIWAFILIGVNVLHELGSVMYQHFISMLSGNLILVIWPAYLEIYNMTHGFKYIGMVTAIIIAIFVTGIFLRDSRLKAAALIIMAIFIIAFALMNVDTVKLAGRNIGIVWTSVIYHLLQTTGLFAVAIYLRRK